MTVHITMHTSSLPEGYPSDERGQNYEDTSGARYTYTLHPSGALTVWKQEGGMPIPDIEIIYGPTAWESVQGDASSRS
ncbi:hypothetical protein DLE01_09650 [Streptomyces sp. FT05W]|nr:hypothetical protein [Streptomyces sp. FT05W]PWS51780.1 hypothetical protein DLE01_09650 [Streptomyces sp. FT05W]